MSQSIKLPTSAFSYRKGLSESPCAPYNGYGRLKTSLFFCLRMCFQGCTLLTRPRHRHSFHEIGRSIGSQIWIRFGVNKVPFPDGTTAPLLGEISISIAKLCFSLSPVVIPRARRFDDRGTSRASYHLIWPSLRHCLNRVKRKRWKIKMSLCPSVQGISVRAIKKMQHCTILWRKRESIKRNGFFSFSEMQPIRPSGCRQGHLWNVQMTGELWHIPKILSLGLVLRLQFL